MKTNLLKFILAVLTLGLLGSCSKINERIDGLDKRVYDLENSRIASIEQQITAINTSINDLKAADAAINGKIDDLKTTAEAHQTLIDALKEADKALGQKDTELEGRIATLEGQVATINGQIKTIEDADKAINDRIDELKSYVDTEIGKAKDWATATFASLTEYEKTADDLAALSVTVTGIGTTLAGVQTSIAGLDTKITGIDADLQGKITAAKTELEGKITSLKTELEGKIAEAISASETSIKTWINKLLEGYYTAAQVDAKIGSLNTAIEAAKGTAKTRIDSVATELTALKTAVNTEKAAIRTEYKNAIDVAITKLDGEIRGALLDSIAAVNGRIEALDTRVTTLEGKVLTLEGNVDKLLAMIQSVSITPAYSDGSVEAVDGILTLKCIVSPAEAIIGMESLKDSLLIYADFVKVKTKATTPAYMTIKVSEASVLDVAQGAITLTADISEYLPKGEDKALTVAVNIKNGISHFTTEFVPVYVAPAPVVPEGFVDLGVKTSDGKSLYWAECNLGASNPEDPGDYYMWGATALMYSAIDDNGAFTFVTENPYGDNYKNTWDASLGFNFNNVPFADGVFKNNEGERNVFTKYTTIDKYAKTGTPDNITTLQAKDDAATAKNPSWRMPKYDEFVALAENCVLEWTTDYNNSGKAGYIVYKAKNEADKGKANMNGTWKMWDAANSKYITNEGSEPTGYSTSDIHIFLPAAGYGNNTTLGSKYVAGCYCSSNLSTSRNYYVGAVIFNKSAFNISYNNFRSYGFSIRPVTIESSDSKPVVPVTGVTLNKTELSLKVGKSETLKATVQPADATNKNVIWSSNNTSVATVGSTDGKVTALAAGTATITATTVDGSKTAPCEVTVIAPNSPEQYESDNW